MQLTDEDLNALKNIIEVTIDEKLDQKLDEKFKEQLGHLPTKDEFYKETARLYKKIDDMEVVQDILEERSKTNRDRIEKLEEIHPKGIHVNLSGN